MHRFRKKSDAKRTIPPGLQHDSDALPELPPASAFRTSLILPDLTRRFTLLRTSSGNPLSLDDLRSRFAEQRAKGAENQLSELEEDMILETLGRIRGTNPISTGGKSFDDDLDATEDDPHSPHSAQSPTSPFASARNTKRYSNNLFGSGRLRDDVYFRSVLSQKVSNQPSPVSTPPTESSLAGDDNPRPVTPDASATSFSGQSSSENITKVHSPPPSDHPVSVAEYRLSKALGSAVFKRASLALEQAIKEIEEEAEDEIVMPRSRLVLSEPDQDRSPPDPNESMVEAGTAISSVSEAEAHHSPPVLQVRPGTTSPTPRLPGYIPGMPRPMTPRDVDPDDQSRSHSTTPRATSPLVSSSIDHSASTVPRLASGLLRRDSNTSTSRYSPRPTSPSAPSPFYLPKSADGTFLPEDHMRFGESFTTEFDTALNSLPLTRRRPSSPLSGPTYQPMAVSSRPGTPSNIKWNPPASPQKSQGGSDSLLGHSRDGSWASENGISSDIHGTLGRLKSTSRSLRSPAFPDSPLIDRGQGSTSPSSWNPASDSAEDNRPPSIISGVELGSPISPANRIFRSPTPTSNLTRSPTSQTFANYEASPNGSPRTSRQNASSSPSPLAPYPSLVFSPIANSSRTSLESAGSSYHSCDGKDRTFNMFNGVDSPQSVWHEIATADNSSSATPGDPQEESWDAEAVIERYAGLTKSDFIAIQEKLVGAALAKTATPDLRDRAPSLRRRRPSTSQSNYSLNGREAKVVSPLSHMHNTSSHNAEKSSKVSALLDSVVDSIQSPLIYASPIPENGKPVAGFHPREPTSRRNRDLAQTLFGTQDRDRKAPPAKLSLSQSTSTPSVVVESSAELPSHSPSPDSGNSFSEPIGEPTISPPSSRHASSRHASVPRTPQTPVDETQITREVQRKTDAAMLALKRTPSQPQSERLGTGGSISRRRISPAQISNPRLVSASTSVDTIPLRSPSEASGNVQATSRLSQRFKKLRGTLRAKPNPIGGEITPYPFVAQSPPLIQTANYDSTSLRVPGDPGAASATETGGFKVPVPSPPASAGPGLKGFMARFRKSRTVDAHAEPERHHSPQSPSTAPPPISPSTAREWNPAQPTQSVPPMVEAAMRSPYPHPPQPPQNRLEHMEIPHSTPETNGEENSALTQLFTAASDLGLDQAALNDLLARSNPVRSSGRTTLTRNNTSASQDSPDQKVPERVRSPAPSDGRPSMDSVSTQPEDNVVRKLSVRKSGEPTRRPRKVQDERTAAFNAVVRRTIIYPSESKSSTIDLNVLMRKHSQSTRHRRSASVASISSRSVIDRVPTPPPSRPPSGRRFSADNSPPVPQLPPSFSSHAENLLMPQSAPAGPIEKSSSTYDSLYEMYAGDGKPAVSVGTDSQGTQPPQRSAPEGVAGSEPGPALEVVEMANGETIWSIVNGLRDEDTESFYGSRTSFASEYSMREPDGSHGDNVQVLVKEHGTKAGHPTFLSRKKSQAKSRPDTKVFYSSPAQIGRLIENLSQGMDAGSFNILPQGPSHSHSHSPSLNSDEMHWTVEERLEHMLGSMGNH